MEIKDPAVKARMEQARKLTDSIFGKKVYIRGIIEFSNCCRKNCNYCGIRRGNTSVVRYQMSPDEIVAKAESNLKQGIKTIVLQSGEDMSYNKEVLVDIIKRIKALDSGCAITLSIGERSEDEYKAFKEAGADRFLMRFETADRELFKKLHPDDDFDERLAAIKTLKKLGYETGSGFMFGIPGEAPDADDQNIALLKELGVAMVGCGPFIPAGGTPMEGSGIHADIERCLDIYAKIRLAMPEVNIAAATALDAVDKGVRKLSLSAGANVVMPNTTPAKYKDNYSIYERKGKLDDNISDAKKLGAELEKLGYTPLWNQRGDSRAK